MIYFRIYVQNICVLYCSEVVLIRHMLKGIYTKNGSINVCDIKFALYLAMQKRKHFTVSVKKEKNITFSRCKQ